MARVGSVPEAKLDFCGSFFHKPSWDAITVFFQISAIIFCVLVFRLCYSNGGNFFVVDIYLCKSVPQQNYFLHRMK